MEQTWTELKKLWTLYQSVERCGEERYADRGRKPPSTIVLPLLNYYVEMFCSNSRRIVREVTDDFLRHKKNQSCPNSLERAAGTIAQRRVDALIGQLYRVLDQSLVVCLADAGGHDDEPIVPGERVEGRIECPPRSGLSG